METDEMNEQQPRDNSGEEADSWASKEIKLDEVASKITNGSSIYIGSTASTAEATLQALVNSRHLADIQILQMIPGGHLPHLQEHPDQFRTKSFFSFSKTIFYQPSTSSESAADPSQTESLADYTPMSVSSIPRLLRENKLHVDVAIIKVTPPHRGFVSLGLGVEFTHEFVRHVRTVIAEVTHHMPWTEGPSKIAIDEIDYWIRCDQQPLHTLLSQNEIHAATHLAKNRRRRLFHQHGIGRAFSSR